ncbi:MAG: phospholipase D-like domain-containing protein, partial [Planctomycetota bacterium]
MVNAENYRPIIESHQGDYWGSAMVGTHSAVIGWDVSADKIPDDLMGFSIQRTACNAKTGKVLSKKWLNGQKRFKSMADAGPDVPSDQCPFQRFRWSDYTLKPERSYLYEVFPMTGEPGNLNPEEPLRFNVRPSQLIEDGVGIYVNRGVTAALAYLDRFGKKPPSDDESGAAYKWLERGLKKSVLDFIAKAKQGEALHLAIYEFFDHEIAAAFKSAKSRGVDVRIVYHAKSGDKATRENEDVIKEAGLKSVATARTNTGNISHNKFIVYLNKQGKPVRLLTASANFTENAFYYQTNVGLVFD